jgi:regulator of protease activity HflC (stomatin/prohibitin superfamily)
VSRRRTTFGKLQRDREKQAKAKAKAERRAARAEESRHSETDAEPGPAVDQATVLAELAELHAAFDDGQMELEAFEARRDELTNMLRID